MGVNDIFAIFVFISLYGSIFLNNSEETESVENSEYSASPSGEIIMMEDAEESFYNVDLKKYDDVGVKCPDPVPPEHGAIIGEGSRVGTVLYLECHLGYKLVGPKVMVCMPAADGAQWDPHSPSRCFETESMFATTQAAMGKPHKKLNTRSLPASIQRKYPFWAARQGYNSVKLLKGDPRKAESMHTLPFFCTVKPDVGSCQGSIKRYYFNNTTMKCHAFMYGGCKGNGNNFQTVKDCKLACLGHE